MADMIPSYGGAEPFLAGLPPTFWSNVPLLVAQIHGLKLINGINYMIKTLSDGKQKLIPLSRCNLIGLIIAIEPKADKNVVYVIDDGTALIDVLV
jgi:hypothetical protein